MEAGEILAEAWFARRAATGPGPQPPGGGHAHRSDRRRDGSGQRRGRAARPSARKSASISSTWPRPTSISRCWARFPPKLIHRQSLFPIRRDNGSLRRRHERSVRSLSAGRAERRHRPDRRAGAGLQARDRQADQDAPGRRQRDGRRPDGQDGREPGRAARGDRDRRLRAVGDGPRGLGRPAGERNPAGSDRAAGQRRAHREPGARPEGPLPHRRHPAAAAAAAGDPSLSGRDHQPPEDHGPAEHRREAAAARRPHQAPRRRPRGRRPRLRDPDDPRRRHRHASAGQGAHGVRAAARSAWSRTTTRRSAS